MRGWGVVRNLSCDLELGNRRLCLTVGPEARRLRACSGSVQASFRSKAEAGIEQEAGQAPRGMCSGQKNWES